MPFVAGADIYEGFHSGFGNKRSHDLHLYERNEERGLCFLKENLLPGWRENVYLRLWTTQREGQLVLKDTFYHVFLSVAYQVLLPPILVLIQKEHCRGMYATSTSVVHGELKSQKASETLNHSNVKIAPNTHLPTDHSLFSGSGFLLHEIPLRPFISHHHPCPNVCPKIDEYE